MSKRIRHHVNPLKCRIQLTQNHWIDKYLNHNGPIGLDIGCGKAVFVSRLASQNPDRFFIGVEIRSSVADKYYSAYADMPNLVLLHGNINLSLRSMFYEHRLSQVYLNFPDPYSFKAQHRRRRMVNDALVEDLSMVMVPEGRIFLQTDDANLFTSLHQLVAKRFVCVTSHGRADWVPNQTGAASAWEQECIRKTKTIYRAVYQKR